MHRYGLIFLALFLFGVPPIFADECHVAAAHLPSDAESAFLHAEYDKATTLYRAQLQQHPNDPEITDELVRVLLRQQKVEEASDVVRKALTAEPKSAALLVARGEVEYRQGMPWLAAVTANDALKIDICDARLHLLLSKLFHLSSMYAKAEQELGMAHALDPGDPDIHSAWIETLPISQRVIQLEAYLASPSGDDAEDVRHETMYLESLKKRVAEPRKPCRLVSSSVSTEIGFAPLMEDATLIRAFGLDVKLNGHVSRLEIDTGAGGILVSRSVAQRAGLKAFSKEEIEGIGSDGAKKGYTAFADSIQIGSLEFHDCVVRVLDSREVVGSDGLIGMDVFAQYLVKLDYPARKLGLSPLPPRPDGSSQGSSLATQDEADEDASSGPGTDSKGAASPPAKPAPGRHDRYIAPTMKEYYPVYRVGHQLLMPTGINQGRTKLFVLDTGSWTTTISRDAALETGKVRRDEFMEIQGISGKVDKAYSIDHVTLDFAGLRQPADQLVSFDTSSISKNVGVEVSGLIGATTLRQVTTYIDYRDGLVKFEYDQNRGYRVKEGPAQW
jgi:predicted aspartyl protease